MKIEKESDTLNREYRRLANTAERLTKECSGNDDLLWVRLNQIHDRQLQIIKELEECTGVKTFYTEEEVLEEIHARNKRVETAILKGQWKERQKSLPSKESKFKASSAPGQTILDIDLTEDRSKK